MFHAAVSVRTDGRGSRPGSGLARTKHSIQKTIQFNSNVMGPRRGRGRTALSTPITHPVQRSINSYTTAMNDKRRGRLIYYIRSHHLPAISCPPWTLLIYFEWTKISDAHPFPHRLSPLPSQTKTTSPLKRKAPTELEMHAKPYGIKVRSSLEKPGEAMVGGFDSIFREPAVVRHTNRLSKGLRRPFQFKYRKVRPFAGR